MEIKDRAAQQRRIASEPFRNVNSPFIFRFAPAILAIASTLVLQAEDSDRPRAYFNFRAADTNPLTDTHDLWGTSIGINLDRHLSVELSADFFETTLDDSSGEALGEYAISAILPQARWRFPLFHDRFSPYVIGGAGWAITQFNDRKPEGFHRTIDSDSETFVATLGAGFDYFFADNIALGVDARYLYAPPQDYRVDGVHYEQDISSVLLTLGLRVFFPELRPKQLPTLLEPAPTRFYLGIEYGAASVLNDQPFPGIDLVTESTSRGPFSEFVGARFGLDIGRHYGLELSIEGLEPTLDVEGIGTIGDYGVVPVLFQGRARFPLGNGRFAPYLIGGAGFAYAAYNDRKPDGEDHHVDAESLAFAAGAGAGLEYYLASNFSIDLAAKYLYAGGLSFQMDNGPTLHGDVHAFSIFLGFRVHLFSFGGDKP